jgi:hypothetical protein
MAHSYDYAVVKVSPDPIRDEALNVAVAVLRPDRLDVCVTLTRSGYARSRQAFTAKLLRNSAPRSALSMRSISPPLSALNDCVIFRAYRFPTPGPCMAKPMPT